MSIFNEMECKQWKMEPMFRQAVVAIRAARESGTIRNRDECISAVESGRKITKEFGILSLVGGTFGKCACATAFDDDDEEFISSAPAVFQTIFVRGGDNALWHRRWDGKRWSSWKDLGGELNSGPGATSPVPGQLHVYALDRHNNVVEKWWNGRRWSGWKSLGRPTQEIASAPAATSWAGHILLLVRGGDNALWFKWWDGRLWKDWESLGGDLRSGPSSTSPVPGQPYVYALDQTNNLVERRWDGERWSAWENLGRPAVGISSAPAVASWPEHLEVFVRGGDNSLWRKCGDHRDWQDWEKLGGDLSSGPTVASPVVGKQYVYALDESNNLIEKCWDGKKWSEWMNLGKPKPGLSSDPGATLSAARNSQAVRQPSE